MTLLTRINFANALTTEMSRRGLLSSNVHRALTANGINAGELGTPAQMVDALWSTYLPGHTPPPQTRNALMAFVRDAKDPNTVHFEDKAPGLVSLILSAPEYQLA